MAQAGEPSVEEILASIKKVIARDNRAVADERVRDLAPKLGFELSATGLGSPDDAAAFLNGQLTNDIEAIEPHEGRYAALLTPKGKMLADMRVIRTAQALFIVSDRDLLPVIRKMMAKVEGMPLPALETGVPWSWRSFGDYLDAELLDHASPMVRAFLLKTAVLDRMTADLCDAVVEGRSLGRLTARLAAFGRLRLESGGRSHPHVQAGPRACHRRPHLQGYDCERRTRRRRRAAGGARRGHSTAHRSGGRR